MAWRRFFFLTFTVMIAGSLTLPSVAQQPPPDLNEQFVKAIKEAAKKVGPSVVQIQTTGGTDMVVTGPKGPAFRKGLGPTTGVIVDPDGYIITSEFNFINNPTTITVIVPGFSEPFLAKKIATDKSRMVTLIKIDKTGLPVPEFVPAKDLKVGQSALALGRTLDPKALDIKREHPPSVSYGIISALERIWGKAIQTDAKISPINYGGPLVDISGRVQGIIIPASPRGEGVTAGFEWYDSGIGFAVPMENVMAVLPKLKAGKDLVKAVLGCKLKGTDEYGVLPEVAEVTPASAAANAGLQKGDILTEIDGKPVVNQAQVLHRIGPKYEGDSISLKFKRAGKEIAVAKVDFITTVKAKGYQHPFLGILAMRDDPKLGVAIRYVYAKSPAEGAGLKAGDRIVKYGLPGKLEGFKGEKRGRDELADFLNTLPPQSAIELEVQDKEGKVKPVAKITLDAMPGSTAGKDDVLPNKLPLVASLKKALEPLEIGNPNIKAPKVDPQDKKFETGLLKRVSASGDRKYWIYVHGDYDPQIAHAVVVVLHQPGKFEDKDIDNMVDTWRDACKENHLIVVGPLTEQEGGWTPSDTELVLEALRDVSSHYTVDKNRTVAAGSGNGGQMAFNLAFKARDVFRGVMAHWAVLTEPLDNVAGQRLAFFLCAGDRDPILKAIGQTRTRLVEHRFPVLYREFKDRGRQDLDDNAFAEVIRWIETLDRL
jgi:S1-C subfamily serine protease